jgi:hypothetical protein
MKNLSRFFVLGAALLFLSAGANGQSAIPEPKRKLISELLTVTRAEEESLKMADTMMEIMALSYPATVKNSLDKITELSAKERTELENSLIERHNTISKKLRERFPQAIDVKQIMADIYYPLYDKYYTEAELKDLITFYSSPTGKKVIETTQPFMTEAMKLSGEKMTPKLIKLAEDVVKEELDGVLPPAGGKKKN